MTLQIVLFLISFLAGYCLGRLHAADAAAEERRLDEMERGS